MVLDNDKRLIGIVSLGDLAIETGDEQLVGSTLEASPNRIGRTDDGSRHSPFRRPGEDQLHDLRGPGTPCHDHKVDRTPAPVE